jgi:predicted negative regulator of RcsB-dependent stress response
MSRSNILYLVVGALVVIAVVLGYQLYQDRKKPEGVNINLGPGGISIQKK